MKQEIIRGRAYLFGDNINTDFINPAQYMELPMDQMIQHAMEGADPDFSKNVRPGDVMVAGINFGSGSSRETPPEVTTYTSSPGSWASPPPVTAYISIHSRRLLRGKNSA